MVERVAVAEVQPITVVTVVARQVLAVQTAVKTALFVEKIIRLVMAVRVALTQEAVAAVAELLLVYPAQVVQV
jgi:hypothetical protein